LRKKCATEKNEINEDLAKLLNENLHYSYTSSVIKGLSKVGHDEWSM
jgi:hypothetical protein